ncbi:hypothetical protein FACS1894199_16000 [Bacteroidia bacterium]|nr:hypothetical protein FACS1894199_16000 [Bacteroidia bacterium]
MLEMLGVEARIVGVCESKYIRTDFVQRGLASGTITDIGEATAPDIEKLVELGPDAMVTSPVGNAPTGRVEKTGIPQIKCVDYMEQHPLGRAEWLRFLALFVGKEVVADSIFNDIANSYNEVKSLVADVKQLPTVLTEMRIGSTWYVPGGQSYVANLLRDAGANYLWADNSHAGSVPLSFESVFERSCEADFWLIKYNRPQELTYESLKQEYLPYSQFEAFKKRNIFVCNTGKVNFYEETPLRPDWLLRECVLLFHPYALKGYQRQYYKEMQ